MKKSNEIIRCQICGRVLKNPKSRLIGIGSTCQKKAGLKDIAIKDSFLFKDLIKL